jgi:serine/threonine protein kinase
MPDDPEQDGPVDGLEDEDSFLKPGGVFDGPLWQELLSEPCELEPGARLGPYEIRAPIGAGGMGEVYRAFDTRLAREVALKVLPRHALDSREAMTRFQREARAVAALNHPNILAIHDVGSEDDLHFAVTELLDGETLRTRLANGGPLSPSKAMEYAAQIAHGLAAAHDRGIVHRDLKPENVFVTRGGRVKILDFGIALDGSATMAETDPTIARLTQTGLILGTVGYVSPEQVVGNPATFRSDLFALGVVMYEMLTGTHPFRRATTPETQAAILRDDPPSIARSVVGLPPPVVRMIDLCLQKQPADRPESARDLALFLEASSVTGAWRQPAAVPEGTPSSPQRLRTQLLVVACSVLVLLTAASWGLVRLAAGRAVDTALEADFARAERAVKHVHTEHVDRLGLTARLVASFPELKALFGTDVSTIQDFLLGFQQRFRRAPVLVAVGREGTVLGRTDAPNQDAGDGWLAAINVADNAGAVIAIDKRPYFAVGAASEAAGTIFGYIIAAEAIDQTFAQALSEATEDEVLLLSEQGVLASTLRDRETPWASLKAWQTNGGGTDRFINTRIGAQRYAAREVRLSTEPAVSIVIVKSRDDRRAPYGDIERGLVILGLIALSLVLLGGRWWPHTPNEERGNQDKEQPAERKTINTNGT